MKKTNFILTCLFVAAGFLGSCKKEKQDLSKQMIGAWKGSADPNATASSFFITFGENGIVTDVKWGNFGAGLSGPSPTWSVTGTTLNFHFQASSIGGIDKADGTGTINGNTVTGTFTNSHTYFNGTTTGTGTFTITKQ